MPILSFYANDRIRLKKPHPCGGSFFLVLRVGSEVRVKCETCNRDMTVDRIKLEKSIKSIQRNGIEIPLNKKGTEQ